jgi:hypothetical protein
MLVLVLVRVVYFVWLYHTYMVSNIAINSHGTGCGETRRAAQWISVLLPVLEL